MFEPCVLITSAFWSDLLKIFGFLKVNLLIWLIIFERFNGLLEQILDVLDSITMDMAYNIAHITTQPGTPTGMNPSNASIVNALREEIGDVRNNLDDILSQNTKLV